MTKNAKIALGVGAGSVLVFSFVPIWSCGLRHGLNFWQFALAHTILMRQPVQYIPQEKYSKPLTRDELVKLNLLFEADELVNPRKTGVYLGQLLPAAAKAPGS